MKVDVICHEDPITGFERIMRITDEEGFWWFLQVGDYDSCLLKAIAIIDDVKKYRTKSKYSWNHSGIALV